MAESSFWCFDRFGQPKAVMRRARMRLPGPGPGQALVAIRAVGLNRAENRYLAGTHFPPKSFPACMSHEAVGHILALGPKADGSDKIDGWEVGDRVAFIPMLVDMAGMGVLREVGVYDLSTLAPAPEIFSDREVAAYWMGILTMAGAMEMAGLGAESSRGKAIAFTAASGAMGCAGLKLARAWGAEAIALTRNRQKAERLSALANHTAIVGAAEELTPVLRALHPAGVDAVIDPLGGRFVGAAVEALATGGHYVGYEWVAGSTGTYDIRTLMANDASIHGFTIFRLVRHPGLLTRIIRIGAGLADKLKPVLDANYGFDEAPEAFEALARAEHVGKITITI